MDARLVWDTWRRILTNDELVECATGRADPAAATGLGAAEIAVLRDYARTPRATDTNIGMYRQGLVRNALACLSRVPLSQNLLYTSGLDVEAVAADFTRASGYADHGPYFWQMAGGFVAYLATLPQFASPARQDVLALDRALVTLARRLGQSDPAIWPDSAAGSSNCGHQDWLAHRFVANPAAIVVSSRHDLTPWIENPRGYDPSEALAPSPRHWLIYIPAPDAAPAYAELSERSARIFDALSTPKTITELSRALDGLSTAEVQEAIVALVEVGVVVGK